MSTLNNGIAALCLLLLGAPAFADDDVAIARRHFEAGRRAYNLGELETAAAEYREAYKLKPDPALLYDIAQAYRLDRNIEQALFFYRSFLSNSPESPRQAEVKERIRVLEDQLEQGRAPPNDVMRPDPPAATATESLTPALQPPALPRGADKPAELVASPLPRRRPVYKTWWLWTTTGVVVVGVGLGVGLGLGIKSAPPLTALGNHGVF